MSHTTSDSESTVMFHRFICRCFVMLFGVPFFPSGCNYGMSSPGGLPVLEQKFTVSSKTFKQSLLSIDGYFYLTAPKIGTLLAFDDYECIFLCLRNPSCWSVNLAVARKRDAKIWCELLSSHKHRFPEAFRENRTSHHVSIMSPCFSSPCHNGGSYVTSHIGYSFECVCKNGFVGEYCEKAVKSCKEAYNASKSNTSKLVSLHLGSQPTTVLCHMGEFGCGYGGWTPVMKINGNKNTFHYDSGYWSNKTEYNTAGGETGFDSQETKLPTYWNTSFSKICLGMKIGEQIRFIVINMKASSLYSLIAEGKYRSTSLGRDTWKKLIGSEASLQHNCNTEGFNVICDRSVFSKARIGIATNNQNHCHSCDSRIGFGTGGQYDDSNTCGNEASQTPDNGDKHIKAIGYILVH